MSANIVWLCFRRPAKCLDYYCNPRDLLRATSSSRRSANHARPMVGYHKSDTGVTAQKKLVAGCVSGVLTRFVTQPVDIVKLRTQLQRRSPAKMHKTRWYPTAKRIFREEGLYGFFAGHTLGQLHSILSVSSQFYFYELATQYTYGLSPNGKSPLWLRFLCGIFAGCCSTTLVTPIEVIRVRQMLVKEQYHGLLNGARMVYRSGGILAFYEGLSASLVQMGPAVGISFGTFSMLQPLLLKLLSELSCEEAVCHYSATNKYRPEHLLLASSTAASVAGFVSKTLTYPFDLAKRRLQIATHRQSGEFKTPTTSKKLFRCRSLTQCIVKTVKSEGFMGLYRGWGITMFKAQLTSVMAFTSYEMMCYVLREMD